MILSIDVQDSEGRLNKPLDNSIPQAYINDLLMARKTKINQQCSGVVYLSYKLDFDFTGILHISFNQTVSEHKLNMSLINSEQISFEIDYSDFKNISNDEKFEINSWKALELRKNTLLVQFYLS